MLTEQQRERVGGFELRFEDFVGAADVEVVGLVGADVVAVA